MPMADVEMQYSNDEKSQEMLEIVTDNHVLQVHDAKPIHHIVAAWC